MGARKTSSFKKQSINPENTLSQETIKRMIRVDQAGEYGAVRIYEGQLAILRGTSVAPVLEHMLEQERQHLRRFNTIMAKHQVPPTLLGPVWHVAGYALGVATAWLGKEAAMACTVAIEEVIDQHYDQQEQKLAACQDQQELKQLIQMCREEENQHKEIGLHHDAHKAPAYPILSTAIKAGSRLAIWLSTRF